MKSVLGKGFSLFLFIVGLMTGALYLYPLDPNKKIDHYVHDAWGIEQGMPENSVNAIVQSADGYLWLGTEEGAVRFDGVDFNTFNKRNVPQMTGNFIMALCAGSSGNLWLGSYGGGLMRMNLNTGETIAFNEEQGLSTNSITALREDHNGRVWIGTYGRGLYYKDPGSEKIVPWRFENDLQVRSVWTASADPDTASWLGTVPRGVSRVDSKCGSAVAYRNATGPAAGGVR
ncbi:MAG: hypothetical protein GY940_15715, partial [bacterium]|nr:hypothetical protein [bacterium]